ncbi:MAG TPA: PEP-CTERM sorting domain-containing protein [Phycisphaerae bacterium]|nr:PEP-CTERM sorting domain-containing protein [Phycisphaerae bacterium]
MRLSAIRAGMAVFAVLVLACAAQAVPLDIVIVSQSSGGEAAYVSFLQGIYGSDVNVEVSSAYTTLDATKIAHLEAVDLIIVTRGTGSGDYAGTGEAAQWNALSTPLVLHNAYIARGPGGSSQRWGWLPASTIDKTFANLIVEDSADELFTGLAVNNGDPVSLVNPAQTASMVNTTDTGNGALVASIDEASGLPDVVRWDGDEVAFFGDGTNANSGVPGGPRLFFALPGTGTNPDTSNFLDFATADGELMLKNALYSLAVPEPTTMGLLAVCGAALLRRRRRA